MNKKGFTLVELLAVIVILALIGLITTTSITKLVKDSKEDLNDSQILAIKSAAQIWGADNINKLPDNGECIYITLKTLKENGLLDNVMDLNTNEALSDDLKIKISSTSNNYGVYDVDYEVNPTNVSGCSTPFFCTVESGTGKNIGDEISCGSEHFYVMSNDGTYVDMLAKYNLSTSASPYLQSETNVGSISFIESTPEVLPEADSYIYDTVENNITPFVETYKNYLINTLGMSGASAKLMSLEQAKELGCIEFGSCSSDKSWLYSTNYWLGSSSIMDSYDGSFMWVIVTSEITSQNLTYHAPYADFYGSNEDIGIRPVITISTDDLF